MVKKKEEHENALRFALGAGDINKELKVDAMVDKIKELQNNIRTNKLQLY